MSENTSRKARGMYDRFDGPNKAFYMYIMEEKSYVKILEKFTIKELSYLSDLYEKKVSDIKKSNPLTEITQSDVLTIAISVKLRTVINKRKIDVSKYRFSKNKLDQKQMTAARKKLESVFKDSKNKFWNDIFPKYNSN